MEPIEVRSDTRSHFIAASPSTVFAAMSDPYQRQYESGFMGGLKSRAMAKVPGLRQQMPVKLGLTGQPLLQNQGRTGVAKATEVFLSPGNYSKLSDATLRELADASGSSE